jgi:hypothetical protein
MFGIVSGWSRRSAAGGAEADHSNTRLQQSASPRLKRLDIDKFGSQSVSLAKRFAVTAV